jgi:hypothetical protein
MLLNGINPAAQSPVSYTLQYHEEDACVHVKVDALLTPELAGEISGAAAVIMNEKKCVRLLNDLREGQIPSSTVKLWSISNTVQQSGLSRQIRRAVLVKTISPKLQFLQNTMTNRGHQMRIFDDLGAAREWLQEIS